MAEGVTHISLPTLEYDRGRQEKTNRRTNTNKLGVTKSRGRYCNTICMCGLSLAWVTSENSTMLLESDSSWLTLAGPYPMLPRLSASVSGLDSPPFFHANFSVRLSPVQPQLPSAACISALQPPTLLSPVQLPTLSLLSSHQLSFSGPATNSSAGLQPPTASLLSCHQLPLSGSRRQLSFASPYHFRIRRDFFVQESFVWFRAKTDSSALAAYPHSATKRQRIYDLLNAKTKQKISKIIGVFMASIKPGH